MAQVGRISGPLLEANLLRQGIANGTQANLSFKNTNTDTALLKVDVTNGRIGVDLETPANELQVSQTIQTVNLIGTTADIANFNISTNNINVSSGDIFLNASERIQLSNLETEQFYVSDNYISTHTTNTDIDFKFNGTGELDIQSNLEVFGDIHAQGNITLDGTITFGDDDTDSLTFNADVQDDITPDVDATSNLGSLTKRWNQIYTNLVNGQLLASGGVNVDGMNLDSRQGGIFYVAKGGDDTNVGDHPQGPLLTIEEALARCDASSTGPVTILVYPGEYEETCPLVVPDNVSIIGVDIRTVVVKPTVATQDKDIFHLNDSSTISDITIKDYYYNSTNNTGYAFRFAPNAVITNRSPYVQNITAITQGSVTSASDPRGFDEGDAGRGAWIDGAELNSASIEASMLFHSATFICPNADVINMTNGVRVEWLNSFTYFANRGLYAFNGVTGRTTYDGSTVEYGAELRSIGSANVYGNYGAVADGADTLMYLIQHNMAYIGAGKFVDNDASRAIYANEVVELNNGIIHFTTTDHLGGFRIGDNFWIDFETGNTTINLDTLTVNQFTGLRVTTNGNTTVVDGAFIDTGNLTLTDNTILSRSGDLNIASANGQINLPHDTSITGNLGITGDLTFGGTLNISGDEATDRLTFNTELEQDFNPNLHQTYKLGSFEKKWLLAHLDRLEAGDYSIYDNVIETNASNANIELRANGTGFIYIPNSATISNALTVDGTTTINGNVDITDATFTHAGDTTQTGNRTVSEDVDITQNISVGASAQFEEILIDDNFITTTTVDTDLELRSNGNSTVNLQENVIANNNLSANDVTAQQDVDITLNVTADNANIGNIEINDNYIETTSVNGDLILAADRAVFVKDTDTTFGQDLLVSGQTNLNGDVTVTGTITQIGDTSQTGNVTLNGEWTNGDIKLEDNFITTTQSNSDLEFRANGSGEILVPNNNVQITNNLTVGNNTFLQGTTITGTLTHVGDTTHTGNITQGGELTVDNVYIEDNFITTTSGDLTLGASGNINADVNDVEITQDLTVSGATDLQDTIITGNVTHSGDRTQTGNYDIAGEITNNALKIEDNFIEVNSPIDSGTLEFNYNYDSSSFMISIGQLTLGIDLVNSFPAYNIFNPDSAEFVYLEFYTADQSTLIAKVRLGDWWYFNGDDIVTIYNNLPFPNITNLTVLYPESNPGYLDWNLFTVGESYYIKAYTDLDLRASGTGEIVIDPSDTVTIDNNLFVGGTLDYQGSLTINGDVVLEGNTQQGSLTVTDNFDITGTLDVGSYSQLENILVEGNVITTTQSNSDLELRASGTGEILVPNNNVQINNNLFAASITTASDINIDTDIDINELVIPPSIIEVDDNFITTRTSNADLELRAPEGEIIYVPNNSVRITNNLTVSGDSISTEFIEQGDGGSPDTIVFDQEYDSGDTTTLPPYSTDLKAVDILGTVTHTGNRVQEGNFSITGTLSTNLFNTDEALNLNEVTISGNLIETTSPNQALDLRASGTGNVVFDNNLNIEHDLLLGSLSIANIDVSTNVSLETVELSTDVQFFDNVIATTNSNSNLELRAVGSGDVYLQNLEFTNNAISTRATLDASITSITLAPNENVNIDANAAILLPKGNTSKAKNTLGDIRFNTANNVFEGTSASRVTFGGVYSQDRRTSVLAHPTDNTINFKVNNLSVGSVDTDGLNINGLQADDVFINGRTISTNVSNSDLELQPDGSGIVSLDDISFVNSVIKDGGNNLILRNTGAGKVKFDGTFGVVVPYGTTGERPVADPEVGDTRWNTSTQVLETWDGDTYITSAGVAAAITPQEFDDLLLEYTLIFG